jgi:ComF family protein
MADTAGPLEVSCRKCDAHAYDHASALGIYEKGLAATILELKKTPAIPARVRNLIAHAALRLPTCDVVVPVPLSKLRMLERGFNQARLIADVVAPVAAAPVDAFSLARVSATAAHRIGMDDRARELSVRNVFAVERRKLVAGKRVLLVDDVFTTGATASACAAVLKKNGAAEVNVFTLARAAMRF